MTVRHWRVVLGWATLLLGLALLGASANAFGEYPWLVLAAIVAVYAWAEVASRDPEVRRRPASELRLWKSAAGWWVLFWCWVWLMGDAHHRAANSISRLLVPGFKLTSTINDEGVREWQTHADGAIGNGLLLLVLAAKYIVPILVSVVAWVRLGDLHSDAVRREEEASH